LFNQACSCRGRQSHTIHNGFFSVKASVNREHHDASEIFPRRPGSSTGASGSWISALGNKLVDTIDSSVLGIKLPHEQSHQNIRKASSTQEQQQSIRRTNSSGSLSGTAKTVEVKRTASGYESEASLEVKVDLKERQRIQRERQLQFLKERGLIKSDN
jgi:hypothetical protein